MRSEREATLKHSLKCLAPHSAVLEGCQVHTSHLQRVRPRSLNTLCLTGKKLRVPPGLLSLQIEGLIRPFRSSFVCTKIRASDSTVSAVGVRFDLSQLLQLRGAAESRRSDGSSRSALLPIKPRPSFQFDLDTG